MASAEELAALRPCEKDVCEHRIPNGVTNLRDILLGKPSKKSVESVSMLIPPSDPPPLL